MIKREKEKYKHSIIKFNKLTGLTICSNYEKKYYAGYGYTGDLLEFVIKCDKFMNDLVSKYESKIYIKDELDKNIFDECYYSKYHRAIKYNYLYGENGKYVHEEDGNQLWGGWSGNRYINNGCYKPTMYKFIKYYKLINPMNIKKYLIDNFA